jgi:hypothetical protein
VEIRWKIRVLLETLALTLHGETLVVGRRRSCSKEENLALKEKEALVFKEKDLALQEGSLMLQGGETLELKERSLTLQGEDLNPSITVRKTSATTRGCPSESRRGSPRATRRSSSSATRSSNSSTTRRENSSHLVSIYCQFFRS